MTGLQRRAGRYYLRRVVPNDLRDHYQKAEITKALGTADPREAKVRLTLAWARLDEEFARLRATLAAAEDPEAEIEFRAVESMSPTIIGFNELDSLRALRDTAAQNGTLRQFMHDKQEALSLAEAMLSGEVTPAMPLWHIEGQRNALRAFLDGSGAFSLSAARKAHASEKKNEDVLPTHTILGIVNRWATESKPEPTAVTRVKNIVARFSEATDVYDIEAVSRASVIRFKDTLLAQDQTPANINSMIPFFGTVLNYAVRNDIIATNPAKGVRVPDNRKPKTVRRAFEVKELNKLLSGPVHMLGQRPEAGGGEAAYWLPLIALFSGARETEIGQLTVDDIQEVEFAIDRDRVWTFLFREDDEGGEKRLKNAYSDRKVPVHSILIDHGLISLRNRMISQGEKRLFPSIRPSSKGELMGNWSKWFGRYRRSLGLTAKQTPFHSLRHTFIEICREREISGEVQRALTGHETGDVHSTYGNADYPMRPLVKAMEQFSIPGLKLPPPPPPGD